MGPDDARRRQLRLALSMNGGVSLAVWIGGAVAEIDELRRGVGFWGDLLVAAGYQREARVDVMAGASAGGLNAVMLAEAIQSDRAFDKFFPLWLDAADIDELVKPPSTARDFDDRAVLDGRYFLRQLHHALIAAREDRGGAPPTTHDLAVFASATMVRANPLAFRDVPGAPILESRSDAYFHVAKRGPASRGLDGFADDEADTATIDSLTALAMIGRATSSLPGLFEPVPFERQTFGSRLVGAFRDDRPRAEIMDGGVVDNVPIGRAIRAIYHMPAVGQVRRVLLYLHPDPGGGGGPPAPDPSNVIQVVRSFSGKRAETIREDIELLRTHNDAVRRRDTQARVLLEQLLHGVVSSPEATSGLTRAITASMLLRAAVDPASELQWHAPHHSRVAPLLDTPDDVAKDELAHALRDAVDGNQHVLVTERTHRTVVALQRLLRMVQDEVPTIDISDALDALNDLQLLCHLVTSYQLACMLIGPSESTDQPVERLVRSSADLSSLTVPPGLDDGTWHGLASWWLPDPFDGGRSLPAEMETMLVAAVALLPSPAGVGLGCRILRWIGERPDRVVAAADVAHALLPLGAEPVASDQHIDFVRIAGNVTTPASTRFLGDDPEANERRFGDRIAGKQLHHLGAFFDRQWRANDLRWGRLDSVPALVDTVLDEAALSELRASGLLPAEIASAPRDSVRAWLVERRQEQLLDQFAEQEPFDTWAGRDRRLASLLGGRPLTSTAIRGTITATRVAANRQSRLVKVAMVLLRPVLLAVAGLALAGRWATASLAWTFCVLAALRADTTTHRALWWAGGAVLCLAVALLVETTIKPVRTWPRTGPPYLVAVAGLAVGPLLNLDSEWRRHSVPLLGVSWVWFLQALAAAVAAATLFFWMKWYACALLTAAVFAWYGWFAYVGQHLDRHFRGWPDAWPFHTMWVAWLVAVLGLPVAIGHLPAAWLSPGSRRPPADSTA